jgi:hypothetical protein
MFTFAFSYFDSSTRAHRGTLPKDPGLTRYENSVEAISGLEGPMQNDIKIPIGDLRHVAVWASRAHGWFVFLFSRLHRKVTYHYIKIEEES